MYSFRYIASLRGHVQRVYQIAWSADSRLLCSGSADSTLKVWDIKKKKLLFDLPGHADEVSAADFNFTSFFCFSSLYLHTGSMGRWFKLLGNSNFIVKVIRMINLLH